MADQMTRTIVLVLILFCVRGAAGDVARVESSDSLKNGMLFGGAIGIVSGVIGHGFTDCQFDRRCARGSRRLIVGPAGLATWVAIGAAIDALIPGRRTIWS